ncbi:MAG: DNA-3-methyladenine glycosylase [Candidatus Pacebacteria bacterium]|nr:DNA-3-methyladenine glycosylase [Candidatus Paceibacterota bacterium]MDR3582933.1 DNA-3-methyladenine glycosylase [Candidatus Paceibacterota bacterium]
MLLKRSFYNRHTLQVARDLLGCFLVRKYKGKIIRAMITETEAYRGEYDLASHASKGRTERTEAMYGAPGHAYIYMIYGMYFMLNVVTEEKDFPAAVLIRAVKTVGGKNFCSLRLDGPGKLTKYLHIDKSLNGHNLTRGDKLWIECPAEKKKYKITRSPRRRIEYAKHCKDWKWNFQISALD